MIIEHNKLYEQGLVSFKMAVNKFADKTREERLQNKPIIHHSNIHRHGSKHVLQYLLRTVAKQANNSPLRCHPQLLQTCEIRTRTDLRKFGLVPERLRDWSQEPGTMWSLLGFQCSKLISLSEQNLIDCTSRYDLIGCDGGSMDPAFDYIIDNGISSEEQYPYQGRAGSCPFSSGKVAANIKSYVDLVYGDEEGLLDAVISVGPIAVGFDASLDSFSFYDGEKTPLSSPDRDSNLDLPVIGGLAEHDWRVIQLRHRGRL
uniref:Peptidase C1A papain C-terminal domain-containing protein n=1 Tax=Timema genevievae TaxID=629358 RepID=A0A7R9K8J9_TIMGE|nr:unnamed protein product [Timema genevievae]